MKFNHLNVPTHWQNYWTRYPEGHTILEALISWVSQVDSMVDNQNTLNENVEQFRNEIDEFISRFDERLQDEVTTTLKDWQTSGFLDLVITEALQWQLDDYITANEQDKLSINAELAQKADITDVAQLSTGTPLFAEGTENMTDTTRNYVNTLDGFLYVFNAGTWESTGVQYQASDFGQVRLENRIENPLFNETDTDGGPKYWKAFNDLATIDSVEGGVLTFTPTARFGQVSGYHFNAKQGNVYYVGADIKTTSDSVYLDYYSTNTGVQYAIKNATGNGSYERISFNVKHGASNAIGRVRVIDGRTADWDSIQVTRPIVIDLTSIFGAGNEPTSSEFEDLLHANGNLFFADAKNITLIPSKFVFPKEKTATTPIHVNVENSRVNVIFNYAREGKMKVMLGKKGVNNIFDFTRIQKIDGSGTESSFYTSTSDWFAPYVVKAVNNANGDQIETGYFTGGNHGYNNSGATEGNSATGRTTAVKFFVDGQETDSFNGYASFVEIKWTNRVQAYNTTKLAGTGREVLEERYSLLFDGVKWEVKNEIEPLEQIIIERYYGMQAQVGAWNSRGRFEGADNREWITALTDYHTSQSKTTNTIVLENNTGDKLAVSMNKTIDLGSLQFSESVFDSFLSNSKVYWNLVRGEQTFNANSVYTYEGFYRFYR